MDQMTGIDATTQLRARERDSKQHIPIVGLTSLVGNKTVCSIRKTQCRLTIFQDEVVPQLIKAGMDDVIFKPVLRNSFLTRLEIWRPKITDAFLWTIELDTQLLDELIISAPTTITQAIPKIIELSNRVTSIIIHTLGGIFNCIIFAPIMPIFDSHS